MVLGLFIFFDFLLNDEKKFGSNNSRVLYNLIFALHYAIVIFGNTFNFWFLYNIL